MDGIGGLGDENSYEILDADDRSVCFVYYENEQSRRDLLKMWTSSEAEIIIKMIARALSGKEGLGDGNGY